MCAHLWLGQIPNVLQLSTIFVIQCFAFVVLSKVVAFGKCFDKLAKQVVVEKNLQKNLHFSFDLKDLKQIFKGLGYSYHMFHLI
jgi:hypothetical protein